LSQQSVRADAGNPIVHWAGLAFLSSQPHSRNLVCGLSFGNRHNHKKGAGTRMKTTEKYPTYVNVDQVTDDQYLVNLMLNKKQLTELHSIAKKSRAHLAGQYHAMVISIDNAIQEFLDQTK
jgi:hypothetical protein